MRWRDALWNFVTDLTPDFIGQGYNATGHARHYLSGLTGTQRRKNIETIENDVAGSDYQGMEQFISSSPWEHRPLLNTIAQEADRAFGDENEACLSIDETSFLKKGKASVGVQRQWSGRAGKVENCQVGVFASLGNAERYSLVDFELYLPEQWAEDRQRCDKAKIPDENRVYKAKWQQALEMVARARINGVRFGWVGVDSLYGHNHKFTNALEDNGEKFMADVRKNLKVWTCEPAMKVPTPRSSKGRKPSIAKLDKQNNRAESLTVSELTQKYFASESEIVRFRQGSKGKLASRAWAKDVWIWDESCAQEPRKRRLVVREDEGGNFKYSLTNIENKGLERDLYIQGQRFWIEHAFHEAKSQTGMAQYQVRVWRGWHHHMALVCLATLFMDEAKQLNKETAPLLSYRDITELLDYYLPRRGRSESEVHAQIHKRHAARQRDIDRRRDMDVGITKAEI